MAIITVTTENFEELTGGAAPVLVDFWAPWCGYCRRLAPAVDQVAEDYDGRLTVGKINIDEQPALAERFQVETIPTLMLFRAGQTPATVVAPESRAQVTAWLKEHGVE